jgi:hypothetical protein
MGDDRTVTERSWTTAAVDKRLWYTLKKFCHEQGLPAQNVLEGLIAKFLDDHQVRLLDENEFNRKGGPPKQNPMVKSFHDWAARDLIGMVK